MSELFSMMTPKASNLSGVGGGVPTLTPEMVAAACTGLPRQKYLYGLARFAKDQSVVDELAWLNRLSVATRGIYENWLRQGLPPAELALEQIRWGRLADEVLDYVLHEPRCKYCGGSGLQKNQKDCRVCHGSGVAKQRQPGERRMSRALNISRIAWKKSWAARFSNVAADYATWESDISQQLHRQVFSDE